MRLTDEQLHELLSRTYPKMRLKTDLMSEMMNSGNIFIVSPHETFVLIKRDTFPRWEKVTL